MSRLRRRCGPSAPRSKAGCGYLTLADEHDWSERAEFDLVGIWPVRSEADGARLVDEHLPLELAVALGISADAAIGLVRDAA